MSDSEVQFLVSEKQASKRGRGRPKCFDEQDDIQKDMNIKQKYRRGEK